MEWINMKTKLFLASILYSCSFLAHASQLSCDELGKLTEKAADMRQQGHSIEVVRNLVGGYDYALDASITDVYKLRLSPKQAFNHAYGLCSLAGKKNSR